MYVPADCGTINGFSIALTIFHIPSSTHSFAQFSGYLRIPVAMQTNKTIGAYFLILA